MYQGGTPDGNSGERSYLAPPPYNVTLCVCVCKIFPPKTTWCVKPPHSPSTRSLARPPRDAMAARSRAPGRGSSHSPRPGRRVHANVQVEVLCAHNGTQHQPKHKNTPHASEQPISGSFPRAHTRRDPCGHGSPIVHARQAPHKPHLHNIAQHCIILHPFFSC